MPNRVRGVIFTLNNYTDDEYNHIVQLAQLHTQKFIIGKEVGEKCETPHLQGFVYRKNPYEWEKWVEWFDNKRISIRLAKGNTIINHAYCMKEDNYYSEGYTQKEIEKAKEYILKSIDPKYKNSRMRKRIEIERMEAPFRVIRIKKIKTIKPMELTFEEIERHRLWELEMKEMGYESDYEP